ncbi:ribosomal L7Ae/L30e/S12e/Gadd45 family protein [Candidatus Woesearchaeota archaeon]|nr:ribosomal L7Ae/L30e/S12e/Gadd45 family protein [Candidatus Woesearchaeota archaeon]
MTDSITEIKKGIKEKKAVIGTKKTLEGLKLGKLQKIFVTSNCPEKIKQDIEHYTQTTKCEVEFLNIPNDELGVVCKKQYGISVLGLK